MSIRTFRPRRLVAGGVAAGRPLVGLQKTEAQLSERDGWVADLDLFARELPARHKNLFFKTTPEAFRSNVAALRARIPELSRTEFLLGPRILAAVGDSHTAFTIMPPRAFPLKLYWFKEGICVTDTTPDSPGSSTAGWKRSTGIPSMRSSALSPGSSPTTTRPRSRISCRGSWAPRSTCSGWG